MNTVARLGGYAVALALAFAAAWAAGAALGPAADTPVPARAADAVADPPVGGLSATADGYTLVSRTGTFTAGQAGEVALAVIGPGRRPDPPLAGSLQLAVVRRDATGFQRLQATPGPDGGWRAPLTLLAGGVYRAYAGFTPVGGPPLVLGVDLFAAGEFTPVPFTPSRVAQVDGYQVRLDGDLVAGRTSQLFATVSRDGRAVTDLEPVDGAFGDLLVLRRSDLAQVPVDARPGPAPPPEARSGPAVAFTTRVPTAGAYGLYLVFRHAGAEHVAEFSLTTREGS